MHRSMVQGGMKEDWMIICGKEHEAHLNHEGLSPTEQYLMFAMDPSPLNLSPLTGFMGLEKS